VEAGVDGHYTSALWCAIGEALFGAAAIWSGLAILNKRAKRLWSTVLCIILVIAVVRLYKWCCPSVVIKPTRMVFAGVPLARNVSQTRDFRVRNPSDDDVYRVVVALQSLSPSIDITGFRVNIPESSQKLIQAPFGRSFGDVVSMGLQSDGRRYLVMTIVHLAPGESRDFSITRLGPTEDNGDEKVPKQLLASPVPVALCITDFTLDSTEFRESNAPIFPIKLPGATSCQ
jgi:hypothetical protein